MWRKEGVRGKHKAVSVCVLPCTCFLVWKTERDKRAKTDLTLQPERGHPLKLGLLQPAGHPLKGLAAGLELAPGLGIPQEVRQGALRPTQDPLGEDGLGDAVPLQLCDDPLGHISGVDLLTATSTCPRTALRSRKHPFTR